MPARLKYFYLKSNEYETIVIIVIIFLLFVGAVYSKILALFVLELTILFILIAPAMARRKIDIFEPINFIILSFLIGFFGRTIYILMDMRFANRLMSGKSISYLVYPSIIALLGIVFFQIGYQSKIGSKLSYKLPYYSDQWNDRRVHIIVFLLTCIGIVCYIIFISSSGGIPSSLLFFSMKRKASTFYLRIGIELLNIAFLLLFVNNLRKNKSIFGIHTFPMWLLFFISLTFYFYTSSRGKIFRLLMYPLTIYHYHRRSISLKILVLFGVIFLLMAPIMLSFRQIHLTNSINLVNSTNIEVIIDSLFGSQNFFGIAKLAQIVQQVPSQFEYQYGKTLVEWIVFPIPRILWTNKPRNIGQVIGEKLFGAKHGAPGGGIPPGFVAELYLNFDVPAVIFGMLFFGIICKIILRYRQFKIAKLSRLLFYTIGIYNVTSELISGHLTGTIISFLSAAVPLLLAIHYVTHGKLLMIRQSK